MTTALTRGVVIAEQVIDGATDLPWHPDGPDVSTWSRESCEIAVRTAAAGVDTHQAGSKQVDRTDDVDVVVVGAGFSGLYLLHRLRQLGFSTRVLELADDVGGTWYWNRYPGARCDIPTTDYAYSFDPELERAWTWSEKYATQPEILRYAQFVAERYDLRRDIDFSTRVAAARWDAATERWHLRTSSDEHIRCRHYVMATGCLSMPKAADIAGADRFRGEVYHTSRWPHEIGRASCRERVYACV